jgi:hypothetical protein
MTKDTRCIVISLTMLLLAPLLFGIAYLLWPGSYFAAIAVLFIGFTIDILGGFENSRSHVESDLTLCRTSLFRVMLHQRLSEL